MYERFFGLADAPFRLTPDPRYLFLSRKHADALAHLKLGLSESSGFVCITGDVGTGKTTLLRAFLTGPIPDTATAYVFNPVLSPLELLQTINAEFGLRADTDSRMALQQLIDKVRSDPEHPSIRIFTIAYGGEADFDLLKEISERTNAVGMKGEEADIEKVYHSISSYF